MAYLRPTYRKRLAVLQRSGFRIVSIGELLDASAGIRYGTSTPPSILRPSGNTVPFIRATDIKEGEIRIDGLLQIDKKQPPALKKCQLSAGEMILVRSGVNAGDCATVKAALGGAYAAYDLIARFGNKVIPEYVPAFLDTSIGRAQLNLLKGRAAQPHINAEELRSVLIPLPPLAIQENLVRELETARESRKKKIQQADELLDEIDEWMMKKLRFILPRSDNRRVFAVRRGQLQGRCDVLYHMPHFEKISKLLEESPLPYMTLGSISPDIAGGATPKRGDADLYDETGASGIGFLRILNVKPNEIDLTDVKFIREQVHVKDLSRSQLRTGDVVMTITGRVGTAAVIPAEVLPANINQHIVRLRIVGHGVLPEYVATYLNSSVGLALTNRGVTGGTRIALDYDIIRGIKIPIPDMATQQTIAEEVRHRREEARRLRAEAEIEWEAAKKSFEDQLLGGSGEDAVAISSDRWQNKDKGKKHDKGKAKKSRAKAGKVAKEPRGYRRAEESLPGEDPGLGGDFHGIREGAGEYDPAEGTHRKGEDSSTRPVDSTRYFETAQGRKTYSEVAEIIALSVARTIESIVGQYPEDIHITPEWICRIHHDIAAGLFPDWAGNFRTVNVQVGTHTPPPFYEVPVFMRLYCEDLAIRLSSAPEEMSLEEIAETLAFADWRFQWIHPFKDFNGRVGRIILSALLFSLRLPPAETASVETKEKKRYLTALRTADIGDMSDLTGIWIERLIIATKAKRGD